MNRLTKILAMLLVAVATSFAQSDVDRILDSQKNDIDNILISQQSFVDDIVNSMKHPFDNYKIRTMKVEELQQVYGDEYDVNWGEVIAKFGAGAAIIVVTGTIGVVASVTGAEPVAAIAFASARGAAVGCVEGAAIGGGLESLIEGVMNGNLSAAKKGLIKGAADGCMWGAAIGAVTGGWGKYKARQMPKNVEPEKNVRPQEKGCVTGANGRCRINSNYAGKTYLFEEGSELARKYPEGVPFDEQGFPHFEKYAKKKGSSKLSVGPPSPKKGLKTA